MTGDAPRFVIAPDGFLSLFGRRYGDTGFEVLVPPGTGWPGLEPAWTWILCRWLPRDRLGEHAPDRPGPRRITVLDALRRAHEWSRGSHRQRQALVWILEESALYTQQLLEADPDTCADAVDHGLDLLRELQGVAARPRSYRLMLDEALGNVPELTPHIAGLTSVGACDGLD